MVRMIEIPKEDAKIFRRKGFFERFYEILHEFPTREAAYNHLEAIHEKVTGERRYADYYSFDSNARRYVRNR